MGWPIFIMTTMGLIFWIVATISLRHVGVKVEGDTFIPYPDDDLAKYPTVTIGISTNITIEDNKFESTTP